MIALYLPTDTEKPLYTRRYTLDGREWLFRFDYNARDDGGCYYLDIGSTDQVWAMRNVKITTSFDLLRRFRGREDVPRWILIAMPFGPDASTAKLGELGLDRRVVLCYFRPDGTP